MSRLFHRFSIVPSVLDCSIASRFFHRFSIVLLLVSFWIDHAYSRPSDPDVSFTMFYQLIFLITTHLTIPMTIKSTTQMTTPMSNQILDSLTVPLTTTKENSHSRNIDQPKVDSMKVSIDTGQNIVLILITILYIGLGRFFQLRWRSNCKSYQVNPYTGT